jgi:hypothetical protein
VTSDEEKKYLDEALLRRGQEGTPKEDSEFPLVPLLQYYAQAGRLANFARDLNTYPRRHLVDETRVVAKVPRILANRYFGTRLGSRFAKWGSISTQAKPNDMNCRTIAGYAASRMASATVARRR